MPAPSRSGSRSGPGRASGSAASRATAPSLLPGESHGRTAARQAVRALWWKMVPASLAGLFLAELSIMGLFDALGFREGVWVALTDATLLTVLVVPGLYLVVWRRVTRLAAALAAATADARFRAVVEAAHDAILVADRGGQIRFANPASLAMLGYAREELVGADTATLVPEDQRERHREWLRRHVETGAGRTAGHGPVELHRGPEPGQRGRARTGRDEDRRPPDAQRGRSLPHREPGRPPGRRSGN